MTRLSRHLLPLLLLAWGGAPLAAPSTLQARLRAESEERARTEANDLLRTLCPEQCVLVSVEARV